MLDNVRHRKLSRFNQVFCQKKNKKKSVQKLLHYFDGIFRNFLCRIYIKCSRKRQAGRKVLILMLAQSFSSEGINTAERKREEKVPTSSREKFLFPSQRTSFIQWETLKKSYWLCFTKDWVISWTIIYVIKGCQDILENFFTLRYVNRRWKKGKKKKFLIKKINFKREKGLAQTFSVSSLRYIGEKFFT